MHTNIAVTNSIYLTRHGQCLQARIMEHYFYFILIRKGLAPDSHDDDVAKKFLLKTYNKIDAMREIGVPEAISHLLNFPDHYTDVIFQTLHTTHLLRYILDLNAANRVDNDEMENNETVFHDSSILETEGRYTIVSPFDDYAYRGPHLAHLSLYDYCTLVYKRKRKGGIKFMKDHPQHSQYSQFIRESNFVVPNLLGRLLFVNKDALEEEMREEYYCLISVLFLPWSILSPP